jgi:hypothetical protein
VRFRRVADIFEILLARRPASFFIIPDPDMILAPIDFIGKD